MGDTQMVGIRAERSARVECAEHEIEHRPRHLEGGGGLAPVRRAGAEGGTTFLVLLEAMGGGFTWGSLLFRF